MERIARETEEDYQQLIAVLNSFGVTVLRPNVFDDYRLYLNPTGKIRSPPMVPRDDSIMLGTDFYFNTNVQLRRNAKDNWSSIRKDHWPGTAPTNRDEWLSISDEIYDELFSIMIPDGVNSPAYTKLASDADYDKMTWGDVLATIQQAGNPIITGAGNRLSHYNAAETTRIGKDLYFGTHAALQHTAIMEGDFKGRFTDHRCHVLQTGGHSDGVFCPVKPGLIVSLHDLSNYEETFPGWEVVFLPNQSWELVKPFRDLKIKNYGKWWVPGEELNDEFTEFVEGWLDHWVGFVEETVFDVNMLVIDQQNVVCNNYNEKVFEAFERHGITPHVVNFRHRYFWDGGLHCITSDVHREGTQQDYFPERK